jgi:hypothetical protein
VLLSTSPAQEGFALGDFRFAFIDINTASAG